VKLDRISEINDRIRDEAEADGGKGELGLMRFVDSIEAYTERHYDRLRGFYSLGNLCLIFFFFFFFFLNLVENFSFITELLVSQSKLS